jgi:tetratricopeptide (TPR) repeat protein
MGATAYKLGDYHRAAAEYKQSYEAAPKASTLYALGQTYRALGELDTALHFYQQYLAEAPEGRYRAVAAAEAHKLEQTIQQSRSAQTAPPHDVPSGETEKIEPPSASLPRPSVQSNSTATIVAPRPVYKRPEGWVTLGAGVVISVIGGGLLAHASELDSQVLMATSVPQIRAFQDSASTYRTAGWSLIGIGSATALAGVILFAVLASRHTSRNAEIVPRIGSTSLTVGGVW